VIPLYGKARDRTKQIGLGPVARQMLDGLIDKETRLLARPFLAEQRHEGRLSGVRVLAGGLAGSRFVAAVVYEVVGDLKREPDIPGVTAIGTPSFRRQLRHDATGLDRIFDERPGLQLLQASDCRKVQLGTFGKAKKFLGRLRLCALAESLGGVETLISHPASMTHGAVPPAERKRIGVLPDLVRISVGLEDVEDLQADLEQALKGI